MSEGFAPVFLADSEKERICRNLLEEFGISSIRVNHQTGEMVHACLVSDYHRDQSKNPTASLNYKKMTFNCLGCGSAGGLVWFISTVRKESSSDSYKWLIETSGLGNEPMANDKYLEMLRQIFLKQIDTEVIPKYSKRVLEPWDYIHPYLTTVGPLEGITVSGNAVIGRGIPEENLRMMKVGWDPEIDRITIPHIWRNELVGWQTRRMPWGGEEKYKSTPSFPKDQTLYGIDPRARYDTLVIVESPMSVLKHCHSMNIAATFGMEITNKQIGIISRAKRVVLWMDNDKGGWKAMEGSGTSLPLPQRLDASTEVFVVDSQYDADAADFDTDKALEMVGKAVPHVLWRRPTGLIETDWG